MNEKLAQLAKRRQLLIEQAAAQRVTLARNIEPLRIPLAVVDRGIRVVRYVKRYPIIALGASALFGILRHTRAIRWLRSGWTLFKSTRSLRDLLLKN